METSSTSTLLEHLERTSSGDVAKPRPSGRSEFDQIFDTATQAVTAPHDNLQKATSAFVNAANGDFHAALLAADKAEISLKFLVSVRDRMIDAYREITRTGA